MDYKTPEGKARIMRLANSRGLILHQPKELWTEEMEEVMYYMYYHRYPVGVIASKFSCSKRTIYIKVANTKARKIAEALKADD